MLDQKHVDFALPQHQEPEHHLEGPCRPTFYMNADVLAALEAQCVAEGDRKRSPFLVELLNLLLVSPIGQQLRKQATVHQRTLAHELEDNLILFSQHLPTDRIQELAEQSQRRPDQMLVRLVLLGLRVYERGVARMEMEIAASEEIV
jgi:hypothetical protein